MYPQSSDWIKYNLLYSTFYICTIGDNADGIKEIAKRLDNIKC